MSGRFGAEDRPGYRGHASAAKSCRTTASELTWAPSRRDALTPSPRHPAAIMAHIPYVLEDDAGQVLTEYYERFAEPDGSVDNILRIHGLNPRSLRDHALLYTHLMRGPSPLSRVQREMIAVTVSSLNDCFY